MGATRTGTGQGGKRIGKGIATTERIGTEKSAHMDMKPNGIVHQGHICQSTSISAVHFRRHLSTVRTCNSLFRGRNSQEDSLAFTGDLFKQEVRARRQQQVKSGTHRSTVTTGKKTMEKIRSIVSPPAFHAK